MQYSARPAREAGPQIRCREAVEGRAHDRGVTLAVHAENAVREWLEDAAPAMEAATPTLAAPAPAEGSRKRLEEEQERTWQLLAALEMRLIEGAMSPEVHRRAAVQYEKRLRQVEAELASIEVRAAAPVPSAAEAVRLLEDWETLGVAERRSGLADLLDHVAVTPGGRYGSILVMVVPRAGEPRSFAYQSRS